MKMLLHYPAVMELEVKIQFGEAMVPATKVSRMLGFQKPRMAVREHVPCFWQYMLKDENDQPVLYLDRSGFEALAKHSNHPHKAVIWKPVFHQFFHHSHKMIFRAQIVHQLLEIRNRIDIVIYDDISYVVG